MSSPTKQQQGNSVRLAGWLVKEGRLRKNWKLRYFVLDDGKLSYYVGSNTSGNAKGELALLNGSVDDDADVTPIKFDADSQVPSNLALQSYVHRFRIRSGDRVLHVAASLKTEKTQWMEDIRDSINMENYLSLCDGFKIAPLPEVLASFQVHSANLLLKSIVPSLNSVTALGRLLCNNRTLTDVSLVSSGLTDAFVAPLAEALKANDKIQRLSLAHNRISNNGLADLTQALLLNLSLNTLILNDNEVGDDGIKLFADVLCSNAVLAHIDLSDNLITGSGVAAIGRALAANSTLTLLSLSDNNLGHSGGDAIASCISNSASIIDLRAARCALDESSTNAIAQALSASASLSRIDLAGNRFAEPACSIIGSILAESDRIAHLDLSQSTISKQGALSLGKGLQNRKVRAAAFTLQRT
eukprot:comp19139_c0_seq1/m.35617 comp19139_c0_seq1/g.35617  ORF comp19139_c0_seq1/g.35617 comp19139_c0_seq1/m.35617 type:complete len:414 (+) comp19139_c0_seq1:3-1244(+)